MLKKLFISILNGDNKLIFYKIYQYYVRRLSIMLASKVIWGWWNGKNIIDCNCIICIFHDCLTLPSKKKQGDKVKVKNIKIKQF